MDCLIGSIVSEESECSVKHAPRLVRAKPDAQSASFDFQFDEGSDWDCVRVLAFVINRFYTTLEIWGRLLVNK
jgi:hypothetical protein